MRTCSCCFGDGATSHDRAAEIGRQAILQRVWAMPGAIATTVSAIAGSAEISQPKFYLLSLNRDRTTRAQASTASSMPKHRSL
jgi:hypothetical protein